MATEIWTAADLDNVRNNLSGSYIQMADIDMAGVAWTPIAESWENYFTGSFEGGGYKISNLSGDSMFGYVGYGAVFKNINLVNVAFKYGMIREFEEYGSITNCHVQGTITAGNSSGLLVGELCAESTGNYVFENCVVSGTVNGDHFLAGMIGYVYMDTGDLSVLNCYANVSVNGTGEGIGSLIGEIDIRLGNIIIDKCYAEGTVSGTRHVGGFISYISAYDVVDIKVSNCYGLVSVNNIGSFTGGFVAYLSVDVAGSISITDCYSAGAITGGTNYKGAFAGLAENNGATITIANCYYDADIAILTDLYATGKTTAKMKSQSTFNGWDFDDVWGIDSSVNNGYPYLRYAAQSLNLQTAKKYALVSECLQNDPDATMNYNDKWYKFVAFIEEFEPTVHEAAGESSTYNYGGGTITYSGQPYTFLASGVTDPDAAGGYGSYLPDTSRTVKSLADRENFVNFYYIYPSLSQVAQPTWARYKLTWKEVENASSYIVKLYNAAGVVVSTQTVAPGVKLFDFGSILSAGTFTATVQASEVAPV